MSVTVRVEGFGQAEVITAIAAETPTGIRYGMIAGVQARKGRPRHYHQPLVIDTNLGQETDGDAR